MLISLTCVSVYPVFYPSIVLLLPHPPVPPQLFAIMFFILSFSLILVCALCSHNQSCLLPCVFCRVLLYFCCPDSILMLLNRSAVFIDLRAFKYLSASLVLKKKKKLHKQDYRGIYVTGCKYIVC